MNITLEKYSKTAELFIQNIRQTGRTRALLREVKPGDIIVTLSRNNVADALSEMGISNVTVLALKFNTPFETFVRDNRDKFIGHKGFVYIDNLVIDELIHQSLDEINRKRSLEVEANNYISERVVKISDRKRR